MKVWRELTLDFHFLEGVFVGFQGCVRFKQECVFDLEGMFFYPLGGLSKLDLFQRLSDIFK